MKIEVINTGSELLLGGTVNTHAAWIGRQLFGLGLRISRQVTIPDGEVIAEELEGALARADVVIVTGGLGPTDDDLTREMTAKVMGLELMTDSGALKTLEEFFRKRGRVMAASNLKQAMIPCGGEVLDNENGTAPGVYIGSRLNPHGRACVFLLPGPPRELYPMFEQEVMPRVAAMIEPGEEKSLLEMKFVGVGESDFYQALNEKLSGIQGLEVGYCARVGEVDLRLIGSEDALRAGKELVVNEFPHEWVSEGGELLEELVIRKMSEAGMTLAVAESCTGGLISNRLTNVAGASQVFTTGCITYSNQAKMDLLGVMSQEIEQEGAVSEVVARAMAEGVLELAQADRAISVTGIAGPGGGSAEKPVGTAWIGLAIKGGGVRAFKVFHPRNREDFKIAVSQSALDALRRSL